jgi:hypothetical protein
MKNVTLIERSHEVLDTLVTVSAVNDGNLDKKTFSYNKDEEDKSFTDEYTDYTDDLITTQSERGNSTIDNDINLPSTKDYDVFSEL